jgi:hypothetical protein
MESYNIIAVVYWRLLEAILDSRQVTSHSVDETCRPLNLMEQDACYVGSH